jgi:fumarate hydratase class II
VTDGIRSEIDGLGEVNVPPDKLWGRKTQRSLKYFSIAKRMAAKTRGAFHLTAFR